MSRPLEYIVLLDKEDRHLVDICRVELVKTDAMNWRERMKHNIKCAMLPENSVVAYVSIYSGTPYTNPRETRKNYLNYYISKMALDANKIPKRLNKHNESVE